MSLLGLGLQEVHELANNDSDAVGAFYGRGGRGFHCYSEVPRTPLERFINLILMK